MAEEKKEMDEYSVPVTNRLGFFRFKVFGGWGVAGILLMLLIRCLNARTADAKISDNEKTKLYQEATKQAKLELKDDFEYIMKVLDQKEQKLNETSQKLDSLKSKL